MAGVWVEGAVILALGVGFFSAAAGLLLVVYHVARDPGRRPTLRRVFAARAQDVGLNVLGLRLMCAGAVLCGAAMVALTLWVAHFDFVAKHLGR